jgi:hypothetical protein
MTARARRLVLTAVLAALLGVLAAAFVHVDYFPRLATYGLSAGTSTSYCSADLVHWHPQISCETAS